MIQLNKDEWNDVSFYFLIARNANIDSLELEIEILHNGKTKVLPLFYKSFAMDNIDNQSSISMSPLPLNDRYTIPDSALMHVPPPIIPMQPQFNRQFGNYQRPLMYLPLTHHYPPLPPAIINSNGYTA